MDRFDLEQEIMKCWHVVDDLDIVLELCDNDLSKAENVDKLMNVLIGISALYNQKFNKMFNTFEGLIQEKKI